MVTWTKEQQAAIDTSGSHILVAAAAGSGKTAVLVERIIQKVIDKENPMNIDEIFVSTFTNAAAEEMRNRIGQALEKAIQADPGSYHLKKQLSLLQRANISTLHSFCTKIIRQYAYLLDIDPGFRIADDMEMDLIRQDVIDELLEAAYSMEGEELEQFYQVVDMFSGDRSDEKIGRLILDLYNFANENPWPEEWLKEQTKVYQLDPETKETDIYWLQLLKEQVEEDLYGFKKRIMRAIDIARDPDGPEHYLTALEDDLTKLDTALEKLPDWDELQLFMSELTFKNLSAKKSDCNEDKKEQIKALRNKVKDEWKALKDDLFQRNLEGHLNDMNRLYPSIALLVDLTIAFKQRYQEVKRDKAIADYSDLEHLCLQILMDPASTIDQIIPSDIGRQFQQQFKEVLVDEYQDINIVQESILTCVSKQADKGNMFMVGDVKQSIYRFRHAEPQLFIDKYQQFSGDPDKGVKIDLAKNFRSREEVLTGANFIFKQILDVQLGEIAYDQEAELIYGNLGYEDFPLEDKETELLLVDNNPDDSGETDGEGESLEDLLKLQLEARAYTEQIKKWIGSKDSAPFQVLDKETNQKRNVQYRDIVILKRSMSGITTIMDEFKKQGIPVHAEMKTGYFAAIEIQVMINMLKVIDNPHQDIPLASVLRSPIVGLNEEELTQIRLSGRHGSFYDALCVYVKKVTDPKVENFLTQLIHFQQAANEMALSELIWEIYTSSGYYDFVGGIPGGRQRQANLRALYDRARGYESTSFRGLFRFLRFIESIEDKKKDLGEAPALSEQEDVVRIMTIHKSKGLEFPIVIVGGMEKEFNSIREISKQEQLFDKDYGFATKYIDPVKRITYPTLYFSALKKHAQKKALAEEMRVLYVAMTRAREKLVMAANVKSAEKLMEEWSEVLDHQEWILPMHVRKGAKSFIDWAGPALIRHANTSILRNEAAATKLFEETMNDRSLWKIVIDSADKYLNLDVEQAKEKATLKQVIREWDADNITSGGSAEEVHRILSYKYPFRRSQNTRAKESVTEIKRRQEVADDHSNKRFLQPFRAPLASRPQFMQKKKQLSKAEIGTAMHAVMQHIPLQSPLSPEEINDWLEKLIAEEKLTALEAASIDTEAITRFFQTDIAEMIFHATRLEREVPFTYSLNAKETYPDWNEAENEKILIQGVIDCLIETENGLVILDYKTDSITEEISEQTIEKLKARYLMQVTLYKEAMENILQRNITNTYLYFFNKDLAIKI